MQYRIPILLVLYTICPGSTGKVTVFCDFTYNSWDRALYTCIASASAQCDEECTNIVKIEGNHKNGLGNRDVQAFVMENKQLHRLPSNITFFFPNLIHLSFGNNLITNLTRRDLKPFGKLEVLQISNNRINAIYEDIFEDAPLSQFEIANNDLEYVAHNLTYSRSLAFLNFKFNKCVNMEARSPETIDKLKDKILLRCSHNPRILELEENVYNIKVHDSESDERISFLENTLKKLKIAMKP